MIQERTSSVRAIKRGPEVLRFTARLDPAGKPSKTGTGLAVALPPAIAKKLATVETAEGTINGHPFRAALEVTEAGGRMIRVNQAMLRGAAARAGDRVAFAMLGPEGKLVLAPDLRAAIDASPEAKALWSELNEPSRRIYVRWVDATNNPQTRARRIQRTVDQLAEGKRRPCCVNTYEYMLTFVDPDWMTNHSGKSKLSRSLR